MFQLRRTRHAVYFTLCVMAFAMVAAVGYDYLFLPEPAFNRALLARTLFAALLALPVCVITTRAMLAQYRLKQSLEYALTYDALTGCYTRRAIFRRLEEAAPRPGIIVVADIDHFKRINDTWGHAGGDAVLRHFGNRSRSYLAATLGERAAIGRIGGEEFLIHLDAVDADGLRTWIDGFRAAIRDGPALSDGEAAPVTASYGVAQLENGDIDAAVLEADAALYRAKETGRDRACMGRRIEREDHLAIAI